MFVTRETTIPPLCYELDSVPIHQPLPRICMQKPPKSHERCALAIAHPGHEVRIYGWMEANRPLVSVLTDGSGQRGSPRIASSKRLIEGTGARCGSIFGLTTDRRLYAEVLLGNSALFLRLADQLAEEWATNEIDFVVGDAREGAIMAHDLWRGVIDRAVELASERSGRRIVNVGFSLESDPRAASENQPGVHIRHQLDQDEWQRKIRAAEDYRGLETEVQRAFAAWGREAFQYEVLLENGPVDEDDVAGIPHYERHGEELVRAGVYSEVVRYREHVMPILQTLRSGLKVA